MNKTKWFGATLLLFSVLLAIVIGAVEASALDNTNNIIVEILSNQLSQQEFAELTNDNNYDSSVKKEIIVGNPILRIHSEIYWSLSDNSLDDLLSNVQKIESDAKYSDYIVFADNIIKIRLMKYDNGTIKIGKVCEYTDISLPIFIKEICDITDLIDINGDICKVENVYYFDATSSYQGAVLYLKTDKGVFVKYFEDKFSEGKIYTEEEFATKSAEYYQFISSNKNNYNEEGEPVGGGRTTFIEYQKTKDNVDVPDREINVNDYVIIVSGIFIGLCGIIVFAIVVKKHAKSK